MPWSDILISQVEFPLAEGWFFFVWFPGVLQKFVLAQIRSSLLKSLDWKTFRNLHEKRIVKFGLFEKGEDFSKFCALLKKSEL